MKVEGQEQDAIKAAGATDGENGAVTPGATGEQQGDEKPSDDLSIDDVVKERLKPIKEKLDGAFAERDAALARVKELEEANRKAELERLRNEGKEAEALTLERDQLQRELEAVRTRNIELTRDVEVKNELSALEGVTFRSKKAQDVAFQEITGQLVQSEDGTWTHKSGATLSEFVNHYVGDESNSFLFSKPQSKGTEFQTLKPSDPSASKSLFELSQAEVLKRAREGKL